MHEITILFRDGDERTVVGDTRQQAVWFAKQEIVYYLEKQEWNEDWMKSIEINIIGEHSEHWFLQINIP